MNLRSTGATSFILLIISIFIYKPSQAQETIEWMGFEEAVAKNQSYPKKKIFIDVYTSWCGWCKKMDASTFADSSIVRYMNEHYYAVKLDAERMDTVNFMGRDFVNRNPKGKRGSHELAQALLQGKMSYPSYVILNENNQKITGMAGFLDVNKLQPILEYFGSNAHFKMPWETYQKKYAKK